LIHVKEKSDFVCHQRRVIKRGVIMHRIILAALGLCLSAGAVLAGGDAVKGQKAAKKCAACHAMTEETNKTGPHLLGIVGRLIASVEGYKYSTAFAEFGKANGIWDETKIDQYLSDPKGFIKGNRMALAPIKKPEERADIIAYLKTLATP
jgi:cytochrome c